MKNMCRFVLFGFILFSFLLAVCIPVLAHSGNTDSNGGHYDADAGEYHYHHGYPAHNHKNGTCPYDNRNGNNGGSYGAIGSDNDDDTDDADNDYTALRIVTLIVSIIVLFVSSACKSNGGDVIWHILFYFSIVVIVCMVLGFMGFVWD